MKKNLEYEGEHISDDECFELDDDVELVDSDEIDMEIDALKIDKPFKMAIQRAKRDQWISLELINIRLE